VESRLPPTVLDPEILDILFRIISFVLFIFGKFLRLILLVIFIFPGDDLIGFAAEPFDELVLGLAGVLGSCFFIIMMILI
jgi:hypothetical protein